MSDDLATATAIAARFERLEKALTECRTVLRHFASLHPSLAEAATTADVALRWDELLGTAIHAEGET